MSQEKSPAFQFYPREYMGDVRVQAMNWTARGMYTWLLCLCWCEGSLPADPNTLADLFQGIDREEFDRHWKRISPCFDNQDGRLVHPRLEKERSIQRDWREKSRNGGLASAEARRKGASAKNEAIPNSAVPCSQFPVPSSQEEKNICASGDARVSDSVASLKKKNADQVDEWFHTFWSAYLPIRSAAKKAARKAFAKAVKTQADFDVVLAGLKAQGAELLSRAPEHRPYASSWLNGERWRDEAAEVGATIPATSSSAADRAAQAALRRDS